METRPPDLLSSVLTASAVLIEQKLNEARSKIIRENAVDGRLAPEFQCTLRVIESRRRGLHRILAVKSASPDNPLRKRAELELKLARKDTGELFRWYVKNHAYGRLDCPGCEYDYVPDPLAGFPVKTPLTKLCPGCGLGLLHVMVVETAQEAQEAFESFREAVAVPEIIETASRGLSGPGQEPLTSSTTSGNRLLYVCDTCLRWNLETVCI